MQKTDIFKRLGKEAQKLPAHNDVLKIKVMAVLKPEPIIFRKQIRLWWMMLAGVAAVIILFIAEPSIVTQKINHLEQNLTQSVSSDQLIDSKKYDTGLGSNEMRAENSLYKAAKVVRDAISSAPVIDNREFLKIGYNATIRTREVEKLGTQIQTMVRGYSGRIDYSSIGDKNASISFVIPKSSLESFKSELKGLIPARFITENTNMQNLLYDKQSIENQTDQANQNLNNYKDQRRTLVNKHNATIASLQRQIDSYSRNIASLKQEVVTDTVRQQEISLQIARIIDQRQPVQRQLEAENFQFNNALAVLDSNIKLMNTRLSDLDTQNQNLLNNVETVQGTVSLQWISILNAINLYVPIYWILILAFLFTVVGYIFYGRQSRAFEMP